MSGSAKRLIANIALGLAMATTFGAMLAATIWAIMNPGAVNPLLIMMTQH